MKKLKKEFTLFTSAVYGNKGRMIILTIAIALFILSAGAPNATIGIGK